MRKSTLFFFLLLIVSGIAAGESLSPLYPGGFRGDGNPYLTTGEVEEIRPGLILEYSNFGATFGGYFPTGVSGDNGLIYIAPQEAAYFIVMDCNSGIATTTTFGQNLGYSSGKFYGGTKGKDRKIYFSPYSNRFGIIDPASTATPLGSLQIPTTLGGATPVGAYIAAVSVQDGKFIVFCPASGGVNYIIYDVDTDTAITRTFPAVPEMTAFYGGQSTSLNRIILTPYVSGQAFKVIVATDTNPLNWTAFTSSYTLNLSGSNQYLGGAADQEGGVFYTPWAGGTTCPACLHISPDGLTGTVIPVASGVGQYHGAPTKMGDFVVNGSWAGAQYVFLADAPIASASDVQFVTSGFVSAVEGVDGNVYLTPFGAVLGRIRPKLGRLDSIDWINSPRKCNTP